MPDVDFTSPWSGKKYKFQWENEGAEITPEDYDFFSRQIEQIEKGTKQSALGAFGSAVGQGLATMPGTVLQGVGAMVGSTGLEEAGKYSAEQARESFQIDPLRREDFTTKAGQAVGQAIGQLGLAVGTGGGSIGTGLVLGTAAAMGAASGSDRAEQSGLTGARRMGRVYGSALTELASERLFGLGSKTFFKPAAIPTTFGQKGLRFAGTSAGEGVEEIAAGVGNNIVDNVTAAGLDIPTPDIVGMNAFKSYAEQGLLGMVGGTVFAGAQLALGSQAAATPVTRAYATVDGARMDVTDLSPTQRKDLGIDEATVEYVSILPTEDADIASGIQNKNVRDMFTEMKTNADAKSLDDALNLGAASSVLATAMGAGTPAAAVTPAATQAPIVSTPGEEAMTSTGAPTPVGAPATAATAAAAAADITEFPADGVTNLVDLSNLRFTGTPTQTPTFNATLQGDFTENRVQERVQTNEGGTPTEAGRGDSTVERRKVEQAVAEDETVAPPPAVEAAPAAVEPTGKNMGAVFSAQPKRKYENVADAVKKIQQAGAGTTPAAAAAPAAPTEIPVPQAPASPQAIVNSIPEITATITGETTGTGSTVPAETISLQSEGGPTGSLPAAVSPMTRVSGGLGAVEPGAPAAAAATPAAAAPTGAPAAAAAAAAAAPAAPEAATTATEEALPEKPEAVDPNNYKTGDSKDIFVEPDKKLFSQFFGEDNPYSLKEKQSDEMLRNEFVRKYLVDGRSKTTQQKTDEMYELMDTLRSRQRLEAQRQQNIAIDPKYGNYDAVPAVQLAEIYLYASRLNDGGKMLRHLKSVGSLFYYSYEGTGRSAARGLNAISHFVRKINIAKARDIHAKGQSENAGKKMGVGKTDLLDLQNFADGATIKAEDLSQGLSEVTANGKSLDNGLPNLITSAVTPAAEPLVTEAELDPQVAAEAASAAEAANVEQAQTESRGLDPNTNTEIGDTIYTANPEPKSPNAPKVTSAQARIIVTQTLGFTPKNVAFEDTDVPNEDGDQYAGKVNKSTKQITINLRNINDSTHLKDVLFEEMDHLVYADPMVQAEIALLAENLPEDIRQEVRQYRPEFQREEATIRFMRRLEQEPNTASLWKKFVDAVRAAIRRLFNGQLTTRDLKMAADRVAARSFQAMAAQTFLTGQGRTSYSLAPKSPEAIRHGELEAKFNAGTITPEETEEAYKIVEKVARASGYNTSGWHFTNSSFNVFNPSSSGKLGSGIYWSATPRPKFGSIGMRIHVRMQNPMTKENAPDQSLVKMGSLVTGFNPSVADTKNFDGTSLGKTENTVFNPNQIKSAEPFTGIPLDERFDARKDDIRYSVPNPNQPAPEAPDLGPNIFTEEASAFAATPLALQAKIKARPAPNVAKAKADPNIEFTKGFIASWDRNSGKEKADAKPKEKIPAKEVISEFTSLPKKGKGYALTDTGRDAFLTALNQKLVDLGVPSDLAFEATRRAWATYSTKKQKNIDAKALAAAKRDIREQQRLAKKTADQAQAALDKPTNTAKDYLKPAAAPKGPAVQDPVRKALRDAEKIPRIGAAFNSSPEARNAFMTGLSSKLISLGVDQQTAWAAANKAWSTYQTNLADKVTALRKDIENNKMSAILARELKKIPVYQQNDIQYVREYMKNILVFGGLAEDVADAAATLYLNKYVDLMKQTKVKAAEKFIESESGAKIKKKIATKPTEYDKLMEAVRLGVTDQSFTAALAFTAPSKFQAFTQADHDRMVALEEEIQDPDTPNLIKVQKVNELMKLADSRMNDINALNVFTGYLVNNTLSGIGTAAIQVFTPFYSMTTRLATDGVRGLLTKDPQRFIASMYAVMDAADTVTAEFKYSFGNDVFRRGQQAELRTLTDLRKILDKNLQIYQTTTNGVEKVTAAAKIALAAPDYVRRLYSAMDTASQSLFINQIKVVGIYDAMKKNGMSLKKFKDMLDAKRTFRDAYTLTLHGQGGYTKDQIRLIAEDAAMNDFGEQVAAAIGQGGAETIADVYKMAELEGPSEIGVAESVDGHVIPFLLDVLDSIKSSGDRAAGQGAGDLAFRLVVGYPTTALKVLNRSLYFFPPTAVARMILNKRYENQADFDPEAPRKYEMLRTESQKQQRFAEFVTGSFATFILMALIMDERDKEDKDRRFAVHNLGPSDRAAKQAWRAAGNVAQSIQWRASETSPWISVSWAKAGLESLAPVLALVGTVYDSRDEIVDEGKMADHALNVAGGVMGVFNRPLSGLNDIGEILSGEKNSISQKSLASYTAFRASGLVPFSSLLKTYNRTQGPRDLSTATSTMMAQIPIAGPSLTEPGLNLFGDALGATPNELTYKLPILPVQVGLRQQDVPFYEKILSKGQYPPLKLRTTFEKTYGPVTDSVWRQYVEKRGQMVKKLIIDRWTDLDTLSPEIYDKVLGKFAEAADETVIQELKIQRVPKPVIK